MRPPRAASIAHLPCMRCDQSLTRGGTPTPFDRVLATRFGFHALELLLDGAFGKLVVWNKGGIDHVDIQQVAGKQRKVPVDDPLISAARAVGTGFGDIAA